MNSPVINIDSNLQLNNQNSIPYIGYGSYKVTGKAAYNCVRHALEVGYRMIDTAHFYQNELEIGQAVRDAILHDGIRREDIFISTKIWNDDQRAGRQQEACETSMKLLNLDYIDLMFIHWPVKESYHQTWKILENAYDKQWFSNIGVCNFAEDQLCDLLKTARYIPQVNQMEHHPYLQDDTTRAFCDEQRIVYQSWSPLGRSMELEDATILKLAEKYGVSAAQIIIRWHIQQGCCVLPKASSAERIAQNIDVFHFEITTEDMQAITQLSCGKRVNPKSAPHNFDF